MLSKSSSDDAWTPSAPQMRCVDLPLLESPYVGVGRPLTPPTPITPCLPVVELHRSLLIPDKLNALTRPHAIFDVAKPTSSIQFRDSATFPSRITSFHRDKPASKQPLKIMTIECPDLPRRWRIKVKKDGGLTCGDIFDAVHNFLRKPLKQNEMKSVIPESRREACQRAFEKRCNEKAIELPDVERNEGMRRVDILAGKTIFGGLYMAPDPEHDVLKPSDCVWVMKLSHPQEPFREL